MYQLGNVGLEVCGHLVLSQNSEDVWDAGTSVGRYVKTASWI
jgi:hypothetical protein